MGVVVEAVDEEGEVGEVGRMISLRPFAIPDFAHCTLITIRLAIFPVVNDAVAEPEAPIVKAFGA